MATPDDQAHMNTALSLALQAQALGEVPVGAVVVHRGNVIGRGHNAPVSLHDPTAHAEIIALRQAAKHLGNYRLNECEIFVTLEPCAMCSGAIASARLRRLVFGASDPKAGAAGSLLDLFALPDINAHTKVESGVLEQACAAPLQRFFSARRAEARLHHQPLREDALRAPEKHFEELAAYPWPARYAQALPALDGLRMHYVDEGPRDAKRVWLCLHGSPTWSYLYRHLLPVWLAAGDRVIAPDLVGFGKSDKPKREAFHSFERHRQILLQFIDHLDLRGVVAVLHGSIGPLGLTLPMHAPQRYAGLLTIDAIHALAPADSAEPWWVWQEQCARSPVRALAESITQGSAALDASTVSGFAAPFPDAGHCAALRAFAALMPQANDDTAVQMSRLAAEFWEKRWTGPIRLVISEPADALQAQPSQALARHTGCKSAPLALPPGGRLLPPLHSRLIAEDALQYFSGETTVQHLSA